MGTAKRSHKKSTSLSSGRPPNSRKPSSTLSSKSTRTTIRTFHTLNKRLARANAAKDATEVASLESQLSALGGLAAYQAASAQGQALDRGGDTSVELMRWIATPLLRLRSTHSTEPSTSSLSSPTTTFSSSSSSSSSASTVRTGDWTLLEVGALSTTNACGRDGVFAAIERIDLRARTPGIRRQDFMLRPLPRDDGGRFDVVSLSLVLNFVPDAKTRGQMLRRTTQFLRCRTQHGDGGAERQQQRQRWREKQGDEERGAEGNVVEEEEKDYGKEEEEGEGTTWLQAGGLLFLVLPAPCVANSRYCDDERLGTVMASLGYVLRRRKQTAKLVYYLWQLASEPTGEEVKKSLIKDGKAMNNFCVELRNRS